MSNVLIINFGGFFVCLSYVGQRGRPEHCAYKSKRTYRWVLLSHLLLFNFLISFFFFSLRLRSFVCSWFWSVQTDKIH